MNARIALLVLVLVGGGSCSSKSSGGTSAASAGSGSTTGVKKSGGFSAALNADLSKEGGGDTKPAETKPAETKPAETKPAETKPAETKPADTKPAETKPAETKPAETKVVETKPADTKPAETKPAAMTPAPPSKRGPTKDPPEIAAIKFDLEPNWDRDYDGAGTFGFELKIPNTTSTRVFYFHYGYDDPKAPVDRDQYLKWIADAKILTPTLNRQRGAAWYLEGTDASGVPMFRYLINYGGKHLICYGSLYKDAASNALGDLRDKVLMQAKKICETLTL